ncbi:MAG: type II secretion system F family protein [Lachnospiraceae bacterium]|nr:type II secretion system F family protein [Lachnospiraceae bacterium]
MKSNYQEYHFTMSEWITYLLQGILLCVLVNYLFYQNWICFLFMIPLPLLWMKWKRNIRREQVKMELNYQFKDALNALSVSLRAGYSVENGMREVESELRNMFGKDNRLVREFAYMNSQIKVNVPAEELLMDFANRCGVEDVANFASVFCIGKRMGGDMAGIVRSTARTIGDKIDVEREIHTAMAAKKMEQMVMGVMPCGIILYLKLASPGFLNILYGNILGIAVMTGCLVMYLFAFWLGRRIVNIEV